jgi:hypothetical protein
VPENQEKAIDQKIRELAQQLQLVHPRIPSESTLYNFAFGALYAFGRAIALDYLPQYRQETSLTQKKAIQVSMERAKEVSKLAANLVNETVPLEKAFPTSGNWLAGFYYNDALVRVDICYEQVTRYFLNEQGFVDGDWLLSQSLRKDFPPESIVPVWPKVRGHVNDIKHKSTKKNKTEGPTISPVGTLKAIEVLIAAVAWVIEKRPVSQNTSS